MHEEKQVEPDTAAIVETFDFKGATIDELEKMLEREQYSIGYWGSNEGINKMRTKMQKTSKDKDPDVAKRSAEKTARGAVKRAKEHEKRIHEELKKRKYNIKLSRKYTIPFDTDTNMIIDTKERQVAFERPDLSEDDYIFLGVDELVENDNKDDWLDKNLELLKHLKQELKIQEGVPYIANMVWKSLRDLAGDRVGEMAKILYDVKIKDADWKESLRRLPQPEQERLVDYVEHQANQGNEILPRSRYDDMMDMFRAPPL